MATLAKLSWPFYSVPEQDCRPINVSSPATKARCLLPWREDKILELEIAHFTNIWIFNANFGAYHTETK
jgi:hypothetical protein